MTVLFARSEVAKQLGKCASTLIRWERIQISPVMPKTLKRNGYVRYTQENIETLRVWMNEFEEGRDV